VVLSNNIGEIIMGRVTLAQELYPEAHIAVKNNRVKAHLDTNIYLKDGSNFEIELYNPLDIKVKVNIEINGTAQSTELVLDAGQRYFLDRFIDEKKKLKFDTYKVDNNEVVKDIIKNNGEVKITFYKQVVLNSVVYTKNWGTIPKKGLWDDISYTNNTINTNYYSSTTRGTNDVKSMYSSTGEVTMDSMSSHVEEPEIETGRIEKGKKSKQKFTTSYDSFESSSYVVYEYKLFPISQKPIKIISGNPPYKTTKQIVEYCDQCGRRIKKGWKYCAGCGTNCEC